MNFFSSKMLLLIWCVFGGFLLHFLGSVFLLSLLKQNYEKPVDTAQDILDRGLTIIIFPGGGSLMEMLMNSSWPVTRALAEMTVVPNVIFFVISLTNFFHFNFLIIRIGTNMIRWLNMRLRAVLLLSNVTRC